MTSALDAALRYLGRRPRSEAEVRQRLARAGHDPATVETTLARLRRLGLVDDAAFAQYWLEQRRTFRPRGARLLRAELRQHGVHANLATEVTASDPGSPEDDAYRAARSRAHKLATLDEPTFRRRLGQFLLRRGFDWDTIQPVLQRLRAETAQSQ